MDNNNTFSTPQIVLIDTQSTDDWMSSSYVPKFNQVVYSIDLEDGKIVRRAKVGNGIDKWPELDYWINPTTDYNRPPITRIYFEELITIDNEQYYFKPEWKGLDYMVFWQGSNRYYEPEEAFPLAEGGFKLIESARIYESQYVVATF